MNTSVMGFMLAWLLVAVPVAAAPSSPYAVHFERSVAVPMRDGVTLRADVFRPDVPGKFPVLLQRTPYDKNYVTEFGLKAAAQGYVVIVQDVRGRFSSEGEWYPFRHESDDGYDTIEWAAALPYSTGQVGMFGGSYVGATQMLAAVAHPPHLAGICPAITASDYHENWTYQGGAFQQWFAETWTSLALSRDTLSRAVGRYTNAVNTPGPQSLQNLPLAEYPLYRFDGVPALSTGFLAPYFRDWLAHPDHDAYWNAISIEDRYPQIDVPALHIGAWYDIFLGGTLRNYLGIRDRGGSDAARRGQRLIVTVGGHAGNGPRIGALDFGPAAPFDGDELTIRWYDFLFRHVNNEFATGKPVTLFVMGANQWRQEDAWPLARARATKYYLHTAGHSLSTAPPANEQPDRYLYDPADPVPTIGGPLCCEALPTGTGPQDQRPVEARSDVLVFTAKAFTTDTEVTGPVSLDLYVATSAADTDFTGMLIDVWPDGFAQNLTGGILRLRYRNSMEKPQQAVPGQVYHVTLDLWATSNLFRSGHRLRLEVSSSNFPRFDRNLNTGELQATATRLLTATNTVYHDRRYPSALIVPLVPVPARHADSQ